MIEIIISNVDYLVKSLAAKKEEKIRISCSNVESLEFEYVALTATEGRTTGINNIFCITCKVKKKRNNTFLPRNSYFIDHIQISHWSISFIDWKSCKFEFLVYNFLAS